MNRNQLHRIPKTPTASTRESAHRSTVPTWWDDWNAGSSSYRHLTPAAPVLLTFVVAFSFWLPGHEAQPRTWVAFVALCLIAVVVEAWIAKRNAAPEQGRNWS